ncbi:MAG: division/cell wall cluster transcriptional repressor MraZ [Clostridia bacterium]|nr:division/cell wall cluster transcriptional repressor MraZ [Clostridia bacterium]
MVFFVGEYERQLDERGRFILPAKIREKLSGTVYITKSPLEQCLNLYTETEWEALSNKVHELPSGTDVNVAKFIRKLFSKAMSCELDKQGRIPLTDALIEYAGLKKDIVLVGANSKLEIWDAENWKKVSDEDDDTDIIIEGIQKYQLFI